MKPSINNNSSTNDTKHKLEKQKSIKSSNESEDLEISNIEASDTQNAIDDNEIETINVINETESLTTKEYDEGRTNLILCDR